MACSREPGRSASHVDAFGRHGRLLSQLGLFESANGLPHGPIAVVLAIGVALIVYPIRRIVPWATRR